jgi:hypothetical protein
MTFSRSVDFYTRQLGFTLDQKNFTALAQVSSGNPELTLSLRTDVDLIAMMVRLRGRLHQLTSEPKSRMTARTEKKARSRDTGLIDQIPPGCLRLRSGRKMCILPRDSERLRPQW